MDDVEDDGDNNLEPAHQCNDQVYFFGDDQVKYFLAGWVASGIAKNSATKDITLADDGQYI